MTKTHRLVAKAKGGYMDTKGRHVIAELWGCNVRLLNDVNIIEEIFVTAAVKTGAEVREVIFHQFSPHGVSGVVIISESHLAMHSFPEHGYASIDVYTCGDLDPNIAVHHISLCFAATRIKTIELVRGVEQNLAMQI